MNGIFAVHDDGPERKLGDHMRMTIGASLWLGAAFTITVVEGSVKLTGDMPVGDPGEDGVLYVDPLTGALRISGVGLA